MVKSKYLKTKDHFKLTFEIPHHELPETEIESISVIGSFNNWGNAGENQLKPNKKGDYKTTLIINEPGQIEFRYLLNKEIWLNDWHADDYVPNEFGTDNCVVHVAKNGN